MCRKLVYKLQIIKIFKISIKDINKINQKSKPQSIITLENI